MNRRKFLSLGPAMIIGTVLVPKLLIPKEQPIKPLRWIDKAELDFHKNWQKQQESLIQQMYVHYRKYNFSMMNIQSSIDHGIPGR